jgi:hypothetical protein
VPVVGTVFIVVLLLVALVRRSTELTRVSLALLTLLGVTAVVVFLTGEPAEELVENLPGVSHAVIERHEEAALVATIAIGIVGALSALALGVFRNRALPRWITSIGLVATIGAGAMMGFTANLGGQIRHTEIRAGAASEP